jgi:hypothetical protein
MKIFVKGGLGNQLFQFSFAHSLNQKIEVYLDFDARLDRPFELENLIKFCEHDTKVIETSDRFLRTRIKACRIPNKLNLSVLNKFVDFIAKIRIEENPFTHLSKEKMVENYMNLGYFQHWKNVQDNWKYFGCELIKCLNQITVPSDILFDKSVMLHIRQGDLLNVKNTMGILDSSYYEKAIRKIKTSNSNVKFNYVILTDDILRANEIINQLDLADALVLGPDDLNAWQTLKVMSNAHFLVAANSTLSWWGAFLASNNGGQIYFPDPWFKNWHEEVKDAFYFPNSNLVQSVFL